MRYTAAVSERHSFIEQIRQGWTLRESLLCVGLDPDPARIPSEFLETANRPEDGVMAFCREVVDATAELVCAFKPQIAYFAALGLEDRLAELIAYIHERHPGVAVILDAKRGDIGDTARLYAKEAYDRFDADAVTVNPYLGYESVEPYLERSDRGVIVLCRTSNPDSAWLQRYPEEGEPVFLRVAHAAVEWNRADNVALVAGATYPEELGAIRSLVGNMPLLVPGIGAQGGDLEAVIRLGADSNGQGLIINASRSVLFAAPSSATLAETRKAVRQAAAALRDLMRQHQAAEARVAG